MRSRSAPARLRRDGHNAATSTYGRERARPRFGRTMHRRAGPPARAGPAFGRAPGSKSKFPALPSAAAAPRRRSGDGGAAEPGHRLHGIIKLEVVDPLLLEILRRAGEARIG